MALAGIATLVLVLILILRPWEDHRSTTREEQPAPPPREGPTPSDAKKDTGQTTVPKVDQGERTYSQLEEVRNYSISGRLVDTDGNTIENFDQRVTGMGFKVRGNGVMKYFVILPDGSYKVNGLAEGTYSIEPSHEEFILHGQYYSPGPPPMVRAGTTDADIVLINSTPGKVKGKVVDADTMLPVTEFTVYHKFDCKSAPDRSRLSTLYLIMRDDFEWVSLDVARRMYGERKEALLSLGPDAQPDEIKYARQRFGYYRPFLEMRELEFASRDGVFEESGHLLGRHVFTVVAQGYLPNSIEIELRDAQRAELTFFMSDRGGTITGRVEDPLGEPLKDASAWILVPTSTECLYSWRADGKRETLTVATDGSGGFAFPNLPNGNYDLKATHTRFGTVVSSSATLLNGRQEPSYLVLRIQEGDGVVWGLVSDTDGSPIPGVHLHISSGSCSANCATNQQGYYRAAGLAAGSYTMTVDRGALDDRQYVFSLSPSQELRRDIAMSECAVLKGDVHVGARGYLSRSLRLLLRSRGIKVMRQEQRYTLFGGAYEFRFLPPGRYELQTISDMLGNVKYDVSLAPGEVKVLDINLGGCGNLKGRITGREGEPLEGVAVDISSPGRELSVTTDSEGCYSVEDLSPGHIQLMISRGKFRGTWYDLELEKRQNKEFDIDFSTAGDVKGQILKPDGAPLGLAALRVESPHRRIEVISDREGRFKAEGLSPGACSVHLSWPVRERAYPFELAPKEDKELEIILPP